MSEAALWVTVRRELAPYGAIERVENLVDPGGFPDTVYTLLRGRANGLLELKYESAWPVRAPMLLSTLTLEQVEWQLRWTAAGGRAFTLAQVGSAYLLIAPALLREIYRREVSCDYAMQMAVCYSARGFPTKEILRGLMR